MLPPAPPPPGDRWPPLGGPRGAGGGVRRGKPGSYLPEESRCGGSSARAPAASSSGPCREGPPCSRAPGTNPESAKIASRPLPSPLLRSLSFLLLFFFLTSSPSSPHAPPPPPPPRLPSTLPEAGEGGAVGAEVGRRDGGDEEVQTNKHANPKSASADSARPEVVPADAPGRAGRRGRAAERSPGDAA